MSDNIESIRAKDVKEIMNQTNYDALLPSHVTILYQYLNNSYRELGLQCDNFYHYHNNKLLLLFFTTFGSRLNNIHQYTYCKNYDNFAEFLISHNDVDPMLYFLRSLANNDKQVLKYNDYLMDAVFNNNDNYPIAITDYCLYQWFSSIYTNVSETNYIISCDRLIVNYIINNNTLDHYYAYFQPSQHNNYRKDIFQRFLNALPKGENYNNYKLGIFI